MASVEFLVKIRDAALMISDACEEYLTTFAPAAVAGPVAADFNTLPWETKPGTKGEYQQTSKRATNNSDIFKALQRKLKEHNGFWQHKGVKYWFDRQNEDVIDRRKS